MIHTKETIEKYPDSDLIAAESLLNIFKGDREKVIEFLIAQCNKGKMTQEKGSDLGDIVMSSKDNEKEEEKIVDVKAEGDETPPLEDDNDENTPS